MSHGKSIVFLWAPELALSKSGFFSWSDNCPVFHFVIQVSFYSQFEIFFITTIKMINRLFASIIALMPENLIWIFSKRYIAGKALNDAVSTARELNNIKVEATIDVLGEYITKKEEAIAYKENYIETMEAVKEHSLKATISVKPTMFGLLLDKDFCFDQIREVIQRANTLDLSICMDMEDSSCTDIELDIFERLYKEFPANVTLVLQSYMRRTLDDLKRLSNINITEHPINIRICKGIYIEPEEVAFQKGKEVNKNYLDSLEFMIENGFYPSIATHDNRLISGALKLIKENNLDASKYEFQMLYGVRPKLRAKLVKLGHPMRVYVPYGTHWFGYSTRRLKENPRIIPHMIKALFVRG